MCIDSFIEFFFILSIDALLQKFLVICTRQISFCCESNSIFFNGQHDSDLGIPVKRQFMDTLFKFESKNFNDVNNFLEKYGLYAFQHRFLERIYNLRNSANLIEPMAKTNKRRAAHLEAVEQFLDEQSNREEWTSLKFNIQIVKN
ncbi:hypothetical protein BpHYR1_000770 [Brachionus plicatilis]|uniref:Uncharacterized protein n=1 Tax=Brachionus plicatilis TaxID=10195 RepID=A0A3M7QMZ2_BRAPC|nr:hypothetical protein BpHYR1_000770 [Brachionus plicatilis]